MELSHRNQICVTDISFAVKVILQVIFNTCNSCAKLSVNVAWFPWQSEDAKAQEASRMELQQIEKLKSLFFNCKIYLSREVPRELLVFVIRYGYPSSVLTLSLQESVMETLRWFYLQSVDEILWCTTFIWNFFSSTFTFTFKYFTKWNMEFDLNFDFRHSWGWKGYFFNARVLLGLPVDLRHFP